MDKDIVVCEWIQKENLREQSQTTGTLQLQIYKVASMVQYDKIICSRETLPEEVLATNVVGGILLIR